MKKTAFITGGAQGIGLAIVQAFLEKGYAVAVIDIHAPALAELEERFPDAADVLGITADIADEAAIVSAVRQTMNRFGRLDVLVNNAGIGCGKPITDLSLTEWNRVIGVNLTGPFLCAKHTLPLLRKNRGSIINIASTRAIMSEPATEAYSASKGGMVSLTHSLAISCGPEIRVNCISPGWIDVSDWKASGQGIPSELSAEDHRQHPSGRVGTPEDIARAVVFLADPENGFITGTHLVVDGGMTRKMIYSE